MTAHRTGLKNAALSFAGEHTQSGEKVPLLFLSALYVVGSKSFRPDIQSRAKWKMLWGIYSAIYGEVSVSVEKCVEIKGDYVEK